MKLTVAVSLLACSMAWGQRATSPSGFGRLANPGGVPATTGGGGFGRLIYPGTGAPAMTRGGSVFPGTIPPQVPHGNHSAAVLIPYPVYYGAGYYDYDAPPAPTASSYLPYDQQQASPVVIINQYFRAETATPVLHDYSNVPLPEGVPHPESAQATNPADSQPIMFLVALKDHTIIPALAYWVEGDTLNYITTDGKKNSASLDAVDREFSRQLNRDRKVDFGLPDK